jgi:hypothetical protein
MPSGRRRQLRSFAVTGSNSAQSSIEMPALAALSAPSSLCCATTQVCREPRRSPAHARHSGRARPPRLVESGKRGIGCRGRKWVIDMSDTIADPDAPSRRGPQRRRRLSDHIIIAFHSACDQEELDAAQGLIAIVEFMLQRARLDARPERRVDAGLLVAAHLRLWFLRHPEARDDTWWAPRRDRGLAADRRGTVRD